MSDSICLVIPTYNEQDTILKVIEEWYSTFTFKKIDFEIIVINDGSTDNTGLILDQLAQKHGELKVHHQHNKGHGNAITNGYYHATKTNKKFVFQTDSDDQFTPQDFDKFWGQRNTSPFLIGIRQDRKDPFVRLAISKILSTINLTLFGRSICDANVPYRLFKREYLEHLFYVIPRNSFAPNIFFSITAFNHLGDQITEIPIQHKARHSGKNSLPSFTLMHACFKSMVELFSYRFTIDKKTIMVRDKYYYNESFTQEKVNSKKAA